MNNLSVGERYVVFTNEHMVTGICAGQTERHCYMDNVCIYDKKNNTYVDKTESYDSDYKGLKGVYKDDIVRIYKLVFERN